MLSIIVFGIAVILFSASKEFDYLNFEPITYYPVENSIKSGFLAASNTVELLILLFLINKSKGDFKRGIITFVCCIVTVIIVLFFFLYGVAGSFADTQLFPFYSLAIIAEFPFFERLDSVITATFIFSLLIKSSVLIYISSELASGIIKNKKISLLITTVIVSIFSVVFSSDMIVHKTVFSSIYVALSSAFAFVILPSAILTFRRLKDKRR